MAYITAICLHFPEFHGTSKERNVNEREHEKIQSIQSGLTEGLG